MALSAWRSGIAAVAFLLGFLASGGPARADLFDVKASAMEVVEEVGRVTDCTKDALEAVFRESPKLFERLSDAVTVIKIADMLVDAKDTEALADFVRWRLGKTAEDLMKTYLPSSWTVFVAACKAYYSALELIRDYMVVPAFEERMYRVYASHREGHANPSEAFEAMSTAGFSGYYVVKPSMIERYIKARGWNKEYVAEGKVSKIVDDFWMNRLEVKYQQDLARRDLEATRDLVWKKVARELAEVKRRAGARSGMPLFSREDLNSLKGWRLSETTFWPPGRDGLKPEEDPSTGIVRQSFNLIREGFVEKKRKEDGYPSVYDSSGAPMGLYRGPYLSVGVMVENRVMTGVIAAGPDKGKPYSLDQLVVLESSLPSLAAGKVDEGALPLAGLTWSRVLRFSSPDPKDGELGHEAFLLTDNHKIYVRVAAFAQGRYGFDTRDVLLQLVEKLLAKR